MARPIVKYLDPVSGEYEFATVLDIGDLNKLNTSVKTDIVSAINSIASGGVGGGSPIDDHRISQIEQAIKSLQDGTFEIINFDSIEEYLQHQISEVIKEINETNKTEITEVLTKLDTSVDQAIKEYKERVAEQEVVLTNAQNTLESAQDTLAAKAQELEMANIGLSELEYDFDELENYITATVRTIDFDNFNAMTEDYLSVVRLASGEMGVDMSGSTLSYLTGKVTDAEANLNIQADEIASRMRYDEFQYMPIPKYSYGENLLFDTFEFSNMWIGRNGAQVTSDTFLFGKVISFNSPTGRYESVTDDLTIGDSYVFSTYVNVQPTSKEPTDDKFAPITTPYDLSHFTVQIGSKTYHPDVYEDLSGLNGWVRIHQEFVADAVNPVVSISPTGTDTNSKLAYMSMPKIEVGLTVTPWQPHLDDEYATMSSTQSMIKQQADSITAFVTEVEKLDDSYRQATSTFQMLADGFRANTEALEAYEDSVTRYGTEYENISGKFEQRVWKEDFEAVIEDINIDNRNRVLNSDFIRNEINPTNRRLIVEDWSINEDWHIVSEESSEYLSINRSGLSQVLTSTATSSKFPIRDGENVLFSFELIHSGLDNDKVFAIELFDIQDKRLVKQEFSLESLSRVGSRYHGSWRVSTLGAEKANVVLQLPKNGNVSFTRVSLQSADIGSIDWSPAPEDSWIIQSKLATYISQVEDEITLGSTGQKIDTLTGLLTEDEGSFTINPDRIATEVKNSRTYDEWGLVDSTNFEQTASGWMEEITKDGRLAGHINASPDSYKISFDKIHLEGTTWADALGSSRITVTDRFALVGQNGRPVLEVNSDGSIGMNVTSMKIGHYDALTTGDKEDIEDEAAKKVIRETEPYIHIAYADTDEGDGLSFTPTGKKYIGFAKSYLPQPSATASNYTWSKFVGEEGSSGLGIEGTVIEYAISSDGEEPPETGWQLSVPEVPDNQFLWTRTMWQYTDTTIEVAYSVSRVGKIGEDGVSITDVVEKYKLSALSSGVAVSDDWSDTPKTPTRQQPYLWNYEIIYYSKGEPTITAPAVIGMYSADGSSIENIQEFYALSSTTARPPESSFEPVMKVTDDDNKYLWNKEVITLRHDDGTTSEKVHYTIIGTHGARGYTPIKGVDYSDGKDGVSITGVSERYKLSTLKSGETRSGNWIKTPQEPTRELPYLWNYEIINYSEGSPTMTEPALIGMYSADGTSIVDVEELYALSKTATQPADSLFTPGVKVTNETDRFLWNKEIISLEHDDGRIEEKVHYAIIGTHGRKGDDGVGIESTTVSYATSSSGTIIPTSGWGSTIPNVDPGKYLWTRTQWVYTNKDTESSYSVAYEGKNGPEGGKGDDGVGIDSTTVEYKASTSGTVAPTGVWNKTIPTISAGEYLWTKTEWVYTNGDSEIAYSVSRMGRDGVSIKSVVEKYKVSALKEGETIGGTWYNEPQLPTRELPYLWNYEIINYSSGTPTTTKPVVIGMYSADGTSITDISELYALSSTTTRPSDSSFSPDLKVTTPTNKYLWNKEVITLTHDDGKVTTKTHYAIIGVHGEKGQKGDIGDDGVGIENTTVDYAASTSGTSVPGTSSWTSNIPTVPKGQYLWTRTKWTYTNKDVKYGYSIAYEGKNGAQGDKGDDGVGVTSTTVQYQSSSNGVVIPSSSGWTSNIPEVAPGQYLWTRTTWKYTDNKTSHSYSVAKAGDNANARNYLMNSKPGQPIESSIYNIAKFDLAEKPIVGDVYTFAMKGSLSSGKSWFGIYNSGGSISLGQLTKSGDYYYRTFTWANKNGSHTANDTHISLYAGPNSGTGDSVVEWATLVKGSVPMLEWIPAHEEIQTDINNRADSDYTQEQLDNLRGLALAAQQEAEAKASRDEIIVIEDKYEQLEQARMTDMENMSENLEQANERLVMVEEYYGELAKELVFVNTHIRLSDEGVQIGDHQQGNYLVQTPTHLNFVSNGNVAAYLSNSELWIESGIFTNRMAVGEINLVKVSDDRIRFE